MLHPIWARKHPVACRASLVDEVSQRDLTISQLVVRLHEVVIVQSHQDFVIFLILERGSGEPLIPLRIEIVHDLLRSVLEGRGSLRPLSLPPQLNHYVGIAAADDVGLRQVRSALDSAFYSQQLPTSRPGGQNAEMSRDATEADLAGDGFGLLDSSRRQRLQLLAIESPESGPDHEADCVLQQRHVEVGTQQTTAHLLAKSIAT
mmetsp:Transcript_107828/g.247075  ORF Transcript_107828/g.247075 Transcript_107828/m.247075 type:complete len:204 (+) Transcript_107828:245-856(+)